MSLRSRGTAVVFGLSLLVAVGCGSEAAESNGAAPDTLRVALLPDESAADVIKNNEPLEKYLEERLGVGIDLVVTTDYSSMIEAMSRNRLELAYFGPLSYVLAAQRADIEPFAAMQEEEGMRPTYQSVLVADPSADITELADFAGKAVAWGDPASTSSHLIPKAMLAEAGLRAGEHYEEHHVGAHDAVALAVQNANAQAGGLSKPIYERLVESGTIDPGRVEVVTESKPYPNYPWTMQSSLPEDFKTEVREAFLELNDPAVLGPFEATGFEPVTDADYNVVRDLAPLLDINLEDFQ